MSIPRRDPSLGVKDLKKSANKFRDAGLAYWEMCHKTGLVDGAVVWVQMDDGSMVIFTRGEYAQELRAAVRDGEIKSFNLGGNNKD